jgi:hypothetical protein
VPDNDVPNVAPVGPPPSRAEFDALSRRVNAIETEARRMATYSAERGDNTTAFDPGQLDTRPDSGVVSLANPLLHMSLPAYMAASLEQVEDALLHRDVALHAGEDDIARGFEEQAAGLACVALTRATDELQMPAEVPIKQSYSNFLRIGQDQSLNIDMAVFRDQEVHLLRLTGLSQQLAVKHLEAAFEAFRLSTISIATEEDARRALKAGADAACATHQLLAQERRAVVATRRRRRRLRRVLVALGGAVIAVANPLAIPLIGPVAVGISVVLGSGAAGAAASVFED